MRYLDFVGQYTTDIRHISGVDNVVADTLSQIEELKSEQADIDFVLVANAQVTDIELEQLRRNSKFVFRKFVLPKSNLEFFRENSTGVIRPYVPPKFRKAVFQIVHGLCHPGIRSTKRLLK